MKKSILSLGRVIDKNAQKAITGGGKKGAPGVLNCGSDRVVCYSDIFGDGNYFYPYCGHPGCNI